MDCQRQVNNIIERLKMRRQKQKMSETKSEDLLAKIDSSESLLVRMSELCMSENYSDVVFVVADQRIPAHRCILAAANKYFQSLLYGGLLESNQKEIKLEVPLEAFKTLLRYIYCGQIDLLNIEEEIVLDLLILANNYGFLELESPIIVYLKEKVTLRNVWPIFKIAWHCELGNLKEICYTLMDMNASNTLAHESFKNLSKELLQDVLRRDSFVASEYEIFTAVSAWYKNNPDADMDSVLSYVRFPLMTLNELAKVRKSGIVKVDKLMDAAEMGNVSKQLPYRVLLGENMVAFKYGSKLIKGLLEQNPARPGDIISDDVKDTNFNAKQVSLFEGIIVELGITSVINHIEFGLTLNEFPYFLDVSTNQSQWERVVDYRFFICRQLQTLYFHPKYVKYIKIIGIHKNVRISALKAAYVDSIPKQINGFIAATIEIYGTTMEGGVKKKRGLYENRPQNSTNNIFLKLNQPYFVDSIRLFLSDTPTPPFRYICKISPDMKNWESMTRQSEDPQTIVFEPFEICFIEVSSALTLFIRSIDHCVLFEKLEDTSNNDDD